MEFSMRLLGIARKAGRLEVGEEATGIAARAKKAKVILLMADASENAAHRARNFSAAGGAPVLVMPYTKEEVGAVIGCHSPAMVTVTDIGLASSFAEKLEAEHPGAYTAVAEELRQKAARAQRRKDEALAHKKNVRMGKRRKKV